MAGRLDVFFDGCKVFWRSHAVLEITLVEHLDSGVIEVICYDPRFDDEVPRLYANTSALERAFEREGEELLAVKQKEKRNKLSHATPAEKRELKKEFILRRLQVVADESPALQHHPRGHKEMIPWKIALVPLVHDEAVCKDSGLLACQIAKPSDLRPVHVKRKMTRQLTRWVETVQHVQAFVDTIPIAQPRPVPAEVGCNCEFSVVSELSDASQSAKNLDGALRPFRASLLATDTCDNEEGHQFTSPHQNDIARVLNPDQPTQRVVFEPLVQISLAVQIKTQVHTTSTPDGSSVLPSIDPAASCSASTSCFKRGVRGMRSSVAADVATQRDAKPTSIRTALDCARKIVVGAADRISSVRVGGDSTVRAGNKSPSRLASQRRRHHAEDHGDDEQEDTVTRKLRERRERLQQTDAAPKYDVFKPGAAEALVSPIQQLAMLAKQARGVLRV